MNIFKIPIKVKIEDRFTESLNTKLKVQNLRETSVPACKDIILVVNSA